MRIWLIHPAEPVPTDGDVRMFRYGTMCRQLADRGIHATQWASTFNHFNKQQRSSGFVSTRVGANYDLELVPARSYSSHIGGRRLLSQRDVARGFCLRSRQLPTPDVIIVSLPTLEMSRAALDYGAERNVPVVVDIRDLWPDVFLTSAPRWLRPAVSPLLFGFERQARAICRRASALTAVSQDYLEWGLRKARRPAGSRDRVFHSAYQPQTLTDADQAACEVRWPELLRRDGETLRCCFFGTLGTSAGIDSIAAAARGAQRAGLTNIEFLICGKGPREDEVRQLASACPAVRYLGWAASQEIAWIMRHCDVGLAAYSEGSLQSLPNKAVEYLSAGLPVLSTLPGELAELLNSHNCGMTCAPRDEDGLTHWLRRLQSDAGLRRQLRANALRLFAEQFHAERVYGEFIDYLTAIAGQPRSALESRRAA